MTIHLQVEDCDTLYARAVAAGCTGTMPPEDMFWGDRFAAVIDPYGHHWAFATTKQTLSLDEMKGNMDAALAGMGV